MRKSASCCFLEAISFVLLLNPSAKTTPLVDGVAVTCWSRETLEDSDHFSTFGWLISRHPLVLEAVGSYAVCSCCLLATTYLTTVTVWPSHVMKGSLTGAPFLHLFLTLSPHPSISPYLCFSTPLSLPVSHFSSPESTKVFNIIRRVCFFGPSFQKVSGKDFVQD